MRILQRLSLAVLPALLVSGFALAADANVPAGVAVGKAKLQANAVLPSAMTEASVLTDANGKTLYTLASDVEFGKSACNGDCTFTWPPFLAADGAVPQGDWTIFTRDDGRPQWAYKGRPLYTYAKDQAPGDARGHNVLEIWSAVRVAPANTTQAAAE